MKIRAYNNSDCERLSKLFYNTVHSVNRKDYSDIQLSVWAPDYNCLLSKQNIFAEQRTLIAENENIIVGFGSIDKDGYLDYLFVHKDWQNKGIATLLCDELEKPFEIITTYSSVTAKTFFEKRGYNVIHAQEVIRAGIALKRFEMRKFKH